MKEFEKVIGYSSVKKELERICDLMKNPAKYKKLGVNTPKGIILFGEPGVGKTLISECFIEASGRKCFVCRKDEPDGDFVKKIKKSFDEAKANAPSIVFLDDIDKFANEDEKHKNAEEFITVQSCIDDIKSKEVFVLATANDLKNLPDSLLRAGRFDKQIQMYNPTGEDAVNIIKYYLNQKSYVAELNTVEIARILDGRSCAELETVINEAGLYAGFDNKEKIDMNDIIRATMRILFKAPESLDNKEIKFIKETAYHEAGHAVIAEVLEPESINIVSVCKYDGDVGGVTSYYQPDYYYKSKKLMDNRVLSLLGGKAATELVYGKIDTGVKSDLYRAFRVIERYMEDYCAFGFDKTDISYDRPTELMNRKANAISADMDRFYLKAKEILTANREFLDKLANALIEKKTLISTDIQEIKKTCKIIL